MKSDPTVLVACPTHLIKFYALYKWMAAVKALTYSNYAVLLVDNSSNLELFYALRDLVPVIHLDIDGSAHRRIAGSMEFIRQRMIDLNFDFWLSIESDIVAPANTIETMLEWAAMESADWYSMPGPSRDDPPATGARHLFKNNFMCSLFPRATCEKISFEDAPANRATDGWFLDRYFNHAPYLRVAQNTPPILALKHLANPDKSLDVRW